MAGGPKLFSGKIKFFAFFDDGSQIKDLLNIIQNKKLVHKKSSLLNNDVLYVDISALGKTCIIKEIAPVVTTFISIFSNNMSIRYFDNQKT